MTLVCRVGQSGGDPVPDFLAAVTAEPSIGSAFWSLFGHDDQCCAYVEHDDGFSLYYPGSTPAFSSLVSVVVSRLILAFEKTKSGLDHPRPLLVKPYILVEQSES